MDKIKLITDSASDLTIEEEQRSGVAVMNFHFTLDGQSYESRTDITRDEFYGLVQASPNLPSTSQLTAYSFEQAYERYLDEGYTDVIFTLINGESSATYGNAVRARDAFYEAHPQCKESYRIRLIDSRTYTYGYGLPVLLAADLVKAGKSADEVEAFLNDYLSHGLVYFVPYSLKHAKKSGRVPAAVAVVGEALGIKPLMRLCDHTITNHTMLRGEKKIIPALVDLIAQEIEPGAPYAAVCGCNPEDGKLLTEAVTARLGYPPILEGRVGEIIASHTGPKIIGLCFRSKNANY